MIKVNPIDTEVGVISGRDGIYLDRLESDGRDLTVTGEFNGSLVSRNAGNLEWIPYELVFQSVLSYFTCELDTYEAMTEYRTDRSESFLLVEESPYLRDLPVRSDYKREEYHHYLLYTYDVVLNVLAKKMNLKIRGEK